MRKFLLSLLAMFAVVATSSAADITDVLNQSVTGITGSSYTSFSGITVTSKAVYAGQCAGSYSSIQLRSNNSNSGIVTTASGGTITKVEVTWNSNTSANRTLQVYVSNTAFEDPTELYGGDATLAGTIVNDGSSTTLEIDGTYAYVGIRSASGAMYLDEVKFTWNDGQDVDTEAPEAPVITPEAGIYYGPTDVTITAEEGDGGLISMLSKRSYFKFDGKNIWDHLHDLGIRIESGIAGNKLGMRYDVTLRGEHIATIANSSPKGKSILTTDMYYDVFCEEKDLDIVFLVAFSIAKTEQTFYN